MSKSKTELKTHVLRLAHHKANGTLLNQNKRISQAKRIISWHFTDQNDMLHYSCEYTKRDTSVSVCGNLWQKK